MTHLGYLLSLTIGSLFAISMVGGWALALIFGGA
jgi:hypothetical protein